MRPASRILLLGLSISVATTARTGVELIDNGYTGVLVAIHDDVDEDAAVIEGIQRVITSGSKQLFASTKQRAYFAEVSILIPPAWSRKTEYFPKRKETYSNADFVVAPVIKKYGHAPYAKSFGGCGDPGEYVHFTPTYLTDESVRRDFGDEGKVVVHEWGHYRWGLQEEYPSQDGGPEFYYSTETNQYEAVRCSLSTKGRILEVIGEKKYRPCRVNNGIPDSEKCRFFPGFMIDNPSKVSIMDRQGTNNVDQFCENSDDPNHKHNTEAPNRMNRLCGGKSSWEVMLEHADFKDVNPSKSEKTNVAPKFKLVQAVEAVTRCRLSLVLDVSGSMNDNKKMMKMIRGLRKMIRFTLSRNTEVGSAFFSNKGDIKCGMHKLTDERSRSFFVDQCLPSYGEGGTSIGLGLMRGVENLRQHKTGDRILLLTDGGSNAYPGPEEPVVVAALQGAKVSIDTITFSSAVDPTMMKIAKVFGGNYFYDSDKIRTRSLNYAFSKNPCGDEDDDNENEIELASSSGNLGAKDFEDFVVVDDSVGDDLRFLFKYSKTGSGKSGAGILVTLTSPSGRQIGEKDDEYFVDAKHKRISISIPENAEIGRWDYVIQKASDSSQTYKVNVLTKPRDFGDDRKPAPLIVYSDVKSNVDYPSPMIVYVEVTKGSNPVLGLRVVALVDRPGRDDSFELEVRDNGQGADTTRDDGVYSRYFTAFTEIGPYSMNIRVSNPNGTGVVRVYQTGGTITGGAIAFTEDNLRPSDPVAYVDEAIRGDVSRSTNAGASELKTEASKESLVNVLLKNGVDEIPPDRITDLRLVNTSLSSGNVTLTFTATGDDYDDGKVSSYRVRVSSSDSTAFNGSTRIFEVESAVDPGETETLTFNAQPPEAGNASFSVVVVGVDDSGNVGIDSNIVTFGLGYVPDIVDGKLPYGGVFDSTIVIVVAVLVMAAILNLILAFFIYLLTRRQRKKQKFSDRNLSVSRNVGPRYI